MKEKILKHLKEDIKEEKREAKREKHAAKEDKELMKDIKSSHKKHEKKESKKHEKKEHKGGKVGRVMEEYKEGKLHSGSKKGPKVTNKKQALAIAINEARKSGEKIKSKKK